MNWFDQNADVKLEPWHGELAPRYVAVAGSESGHCCFGATVIDQTMPTLNGDGENMVLSGVPKFEAICECCDMESAERIAAALNRP